MDSKLNTFAESSAKTAPTSIPGFKSQLTQNNQSQSNVFLHSQLPLVNQSEQSDNRSMLSGGAMPATGSPLSSLQDQMMMSNPLLRSRLLLGQEGGASHFPSMSTTSDPSMSMSPALPLASHQALLQYQTAMALGGTANGGSFFPQQQLLPHFLAQQQGQPFGGVVPSNNTMMAAYPNQLAAQSLFQQQGLIGALTAANPSSSGKIGGIGDYKMISGENFPAYNSSLLNFQPGSHLPLSSTGAFAAANFQNQKTAHTGGVAAPADHDDDEEDYYDSSKRSQSQGKSRKKRRKENIFKPRKKRTYRHEGFPERLHRLLVELEREGKKDIVSFTECGKGVIVHKAEDFESEILPRYFRHSKLSSFQRQLLLYGFDRVKQGKDRGAFVHELFSRDSEDLKEIQRTDY